MLFWKSRCGTSIPWDDDLDLGSFIGLHGLTEKSIDRVVAAFRDNGYFAKVERNDHYISVAMMKSYIRTDWICRWIIDDSIFQADGTDAPPSPRERGEPAKMKN